MVWSTYNFSKKYFFISESKPASKLSSFNTIRIEGGLADTWRSQLFYAGGQIN
jgi:hypothetical protein